MLLFGNKHVKLRKSLPSHFQASSEPPPNHPPTTSEPLPNHFRTTSEPPLPNHPEPLPNHLRTPSKPRGVCTSPTAVLRRWTHPLPYPTLAQTRQELNKQASNNPKIAKKQPKFGTSRTEKPLRTLLPECNQQQAKRLPHTNAKSPVYLCFRRQRLWKPLLRASAATRRLPKTCCEREAIRQINGTWF